MIRQRGEAIKTALAEYFSEQETETVDIPILQPADPFLDMAGEELRSRIFLTENEMGDSLCLRPEFTIPVCRNHIELNAATPRRYAYIGEVFRQRREGGTGFHQAGIEDLGSRDQPAADARSLADALKAVKSAVPEAKWRTLLGDQSVFEAVLAALGLPRGWQKRLARTFGNPEQLKLALHDLGSERTNGVLADQLALLVAAGDEAGLTAYLEAEMQAAGISPAAGRTPAEIAHRLLEKEQLAAIQLPEKTIAALEYFLSIREPLDKAPAVLAEFAQSNGINLEKALTGFIARVEAITAAGIDLQHVIYDAGFGRPLDYYTGLVYEITNQECDCGVVVGGGRYDRLLTMLGANEPISGVGFSIWLDRLEQCASQETPGKTSASGDKS